MKEVAATDRTGTAGSPSLAGFTAEAPKVTGLRARAVMVPVDPPVQTAAGAVDTAPLVLVDLATDAGVTGRAYVLAYLPLAAAPTAALVNNMEPLVKGMPLAPRALSRHVASRFRLLGPQGLVGLALSGIDMAAWDAQARTLGVSLARLLGAAGDERLRAYASLRGITVAQVTGEAASAMQSGFQAFKIKVGHASLAEEIEVVRALRSVAGPGASIMVDYNQALDLPEAIRRARALDGEGVAWIEEPLRADDYAGHAAVAAAAETPIQVGENFWGPDEAARSIGAHGSDLLMPDLMKIGGVTGWMDTSALASAAGLPVSSHIFVEFSSQVMAATPGRHMVEWLDLAGPVLREGTPSVSDGHVIPAAGPGAGIEWDEGAVAKFLA